MQAPPSNVEQSSDLFCLLTKEEIEVLLWEYVLDAAQALAVYLGSPSPAQKELAAGRLMGIQQECPRLFSAALRSALDRHGLTLSQLLGRLGRDSNPPNGPGVAPATSVRQLAKALAGAIDDRAGRLGAAAAAP